MISLPSPRLGSLHARSAKVSHVWWRRRAGSPSSKLTRPVLLADMAQYLFPLRNSTTTSVPSLPKDAEDDAENPTLIPSSRLLDASIHHTFLIRTPKKAVPSYYRLCYPGSPTGFEYWDPDEAGYAEERKLFDYLRSQGLDPLVIDSEDLLKDPAGIMEMWCQDSQIPFEERMLSWGEGTREHL